MEREKVQVHVDGIPGDRLIVMGEGEYYEMVKAVRELEEELRACRLMPEGFALVQRTPFSGNFVIGPKAKAFTRFLRWTRGSERASKLRRREDPRPGSRDRLRDELCIAREAGAVKPRT